MYICNNSHTLVSDPFDACMSAVQPHTAIFPCPYSYKNVKDDDALGK